MTRNASPKRRRADRARARRRAGRPRAAANRDEARDRIVRSAAERFARRGFGATTTAEIARAARVSEGTLFHHFPTKRALLAEVGEREGERVLAIAFAGVDPDAPPPDPEVILRRLFAYAREAPDAYRLFAMDGDLEDLASGFSAKRARVTAGLAAVLAAWRARGFIGSGGPAAAPDPAILAELVFALCDTAVRRLVLEERWDEHDAWLRETARAVRSLLEPVDPARGPSARLRGEP